MELRRKLMALLMTEMLVGVMSAAPALAHHDVGHVNNDRGLDMGNKLNDGEDPNKGGGQEHPKNERPPHGGGEQHGGGSV